MRIWYLIFTVIIFFQPHQVKAEMISSINIRQKEALNPTISSPIPGQAVQGAIVIRGNTSVNGFQSYEVDFAYSTDSTQTWFLIEESTLPVQDGILAVWDTSTITDGDYNLRLIITRTDGEQVEIQVTDLRVRNNTPIETDNPTPTQGSLVMGIPTLTSTPQAISTLMTTSQPATPTPLLANPIEVSTSQIILTFGKGVAYTIGIFALLGAYVGIRAVVHNRK